jgi:hypothetical protein
LILIAALIIASVLNQQFSFHADIAATEEIETIHQPSNLLFRVINSILDLSAFWSGWQSMWHYLSSDSLIPLAILAGFSLLCLSWRYVAKNWRAGDHAGLFIALSAGLLILEMIALLDGRWRHGRYYFVVLFPLLVMLAAYTVKELALLTGYLLDRLSYPYLKHERRLLKLLPVCVLSLWLTIAFYKDITTELSETFEKYRYDLAWRYVAQERQPGDSTMSAWPAAAYLYNGQIDYYAHQTGPVVMPDYPGGDDLVDKYASALLVDTSEELTKVLAQSGRTWFVIEDANLFNFFEADFIQQIFQQMRLARSFDNMHVFVEKDILWPLPQKPAHAAHEDLSGQMIFKGYTLQPSRPALGQSVFLTLFWQPVNPIFNYKVFVHLRNSTGNTVTQADFVPLEGATVDLRGWVRRKGSHILRTANLLNLPAMLPEDRYTLWVGLYEPKTLQRVPISRDISGENAIKLAVFSLVHKPRSP